EFAFALEVVRDVADLVGELHLVRGLAELVGTVQRFVHPQGTEHERGDRRDDEDQCELRSEPPVAQAASGAAVTGPFAGRRGGGRLGGRALGAVAAGLPFLRLLVEHYEHTPKVRALRLLPIGHPDRDLLVPAPGTEPPATPMAIGRRTDRRLP